MSTSSEPDRAGRSGWQVSFRAWLIPRYPELSLFVLIVVSAAIIVGGTRVITLLALGDHLTTALWTTALLISINLSAGMMFALVWRWLLPGRVFASAGLALGLVAAYMPFLGAALGGTWLMLWAGWAMSLRHYPDTTLFAAGQLIFWGLLWSVAVLIANHMTEARQRRREYERELENRLYQIQESRRRIVEAQEQVRKDVAQRLHGQVQSKLLLAWHWLQQAKEKAGDPEAQRLVSQAADIVGEVNEEDVRVIAHQLHPFIIRLGLVSSLRALVDPLQGQFAIDLHVDSPNPECEDSQVLRALPEELRLAVYRVVQEALNNVVRHAAASRVDIGLFLPGGGQLNVVVKDNGKGFDPASTQPGFGLQSMQDYCGAFGGTLAVESRLGAGTTVSATFPLGRGSPGA